MFNPLRIPVRLAEITWSLVFHPKCYCRYQLQLGPFKATWRKRMTFHLNGALGPTFGCSVCHVLEVL